MEREAGEAQSDPTAVVKELVGYETREEAMTALGSE